MEFKEENTTKNEENKEKPKKKKWKFYFILVVSMVIFAIAMLTSEGLSKKVGLDDFVVSFLPSSLEQVQIEGGEIGIRGGSLLFNRNGKQIKIDVIAVVNGSEIDITTNLNWWHRTQGENGHKFGANVTIPDNPTGGFIANNLEEIRFVIHTENVTLGQARNSIKNGFHYTDECHVEGMNRVCKKVEFDFSDILGALNRERMDIERDSAYNATIIFDVEDINFFRGQVIELDPSITIIDSVDVVSLLTNISLRGGKNMLFLNEYLLVCILLKAIYQHTLKLQNFLPIQN